MAQWFYRIDQREHGPVPDLGLASLLADGTLKPSDDVREVGGSAWRAASDALAMHERAGTAAEWQSHDLDSLLSSETAVSVATRRSTSVADEGSDFELQGFDPTDEASSLDLDDMLAASDSTVAQPPKAAKAVEAPAAADQWFYKSKGREFGPVPFLVIQNLVEGGAFTPDDFLKPGEKGAWQRAARISGLFTDNTLSQWRQRRAESSFGRISGTDSDVIASDVIASDSEIEEDAATSGQDRRPPVKEATPKNKKSASQKAKSKSRKRPGKEEAEALAASILEEMEEEETPPPKPREASPRAVPAAAVPEIATTETQTSLSAPTPVPAPRAYSPPITAGFDASKFKKAKPARSSSGGFSLPFEFDPKIGMIAAAVVAVVAGLYFTPFGTMFISGSGPAKEILPKAEEMWSQVQELRGNKKAGDSQWEQLEGELISSLNTHIAELQPYAKGSEGARLLYKFESSGLKPILARGRSAPPKLYEDAEKFLGEAKKLLASN